MTVRKIVRESVSDQVFSQLKQQLLDGQWRAGDKIPSENELAELFGVSRVTVRNALQKLAALNLIETRYGEGSFVKEIQAASAMDAMIPAAYINDQALLEILQFRKMIEGPVCEAACQAADPQEIAKLGQLYEKMMQSTKDLKTFAMYDFQFHQKIVMMTGNTILMQIYSIIQEIMEHAFDKIVLARGSSAGIYYHGLIVKAFEAKDAKEAARIMQEHMIDLYESYLREFKPQ